MNKTFYTTERGIISLIAIFGVGLFALGAVLSVSTGTLAELVKNKNAVTGSQTFYTAESAMREGAYQFVGEVDETQNENFRTLDYFTLNNTTESGVVVSDLGWPYAEARGAALNGDINRTVIHTITIFPEGLAFDYAVYAQYDLTMGGSLEVNGDIFANDGINFNGNPDVNGDVYSAGEIESGGDIIGTVTENLEPIPPPTLDPTPYSDAATFEGTYFTNASDAETLLKDATINAHIFVEDTATTKVQNTNLTGFLYVKGDLQITGGGTFAADENFAVIIVEGDLSISGGATINGIVYANGSTSFGGGNNIINGSLISAGGESVTVVTGNATINFDPDVYANWQDIEGLNQVSTEEPRIIKWEEE